MTHFHLLRLTRAVRPQLALLVAIGLVLSALALTQALALASLFAGILAGRDLAALALPLALLGGALLARPLVTGVREIWAHHTASALKRGLRSRLLDADEALGPFADSRERIGTRHALLVDGVENLEPYTTRFLPQVAITAITATVTAGLLIAIDPVVGGACAAVALLVPIAPRLWDRVLRRLGEEHWRAYSDMHADVTDAMRGMETLKLLGAASRRRASLAAASERLLRSTLTQLRLSLVESGLTGFLLVAGPALALLIGVARVSSGALPAAALFALVLLSVEVFRPFRDLANHWHAGYLGVAAGERVLARLAQVERAERSDGSDGTDATDASDRTSSSAPAPPAARPAEGLAIALEGATARYPGAAQPSLSGARIEIPRGTMTAIVGPSGAGKSTLANVLLGLLPLESGSVALEPGALAPEPDSPTPEPGSPTPEPGARTPAEGRPLVPRIALVSQSPVIFSGTVRDNLRAVAPAAADAELRRALEDAQAPELCAGARGLDTPVGDSGALLSGGQRQRLAIARVLLMGASIVVLDEATSALDARRERELLRLLRRAISGPGPLHTVVIIAHRLQAIRDADLIVVMDSGRAIASGRYDALLESCPLFARMHAAQAERVGS